MLEIPFEKECTKKAEKRGMVVYKFKSPARRSVPDKLFICQRGIFFVEFKRPDGDGVVTKLQLRTHKKMRKAGATVYVCQDPQHFECILYEWTN